MMFIRKKKDYLDFYYNETLNEKAFLLEAGQGKNINGNIYAFLCELRVNKKWKDFSIYLVVTKDTLESAKSRVKFYGYDDINFIIRNSLKYKKALAKCKYLITDNSFPPYYIKKEGQVILNTWHGTPLKVLGRCDIVNSSSISNVQKNFAMSDYILFPNEYTKDVFMEDYCLKNVLKNQIIMADYPRNTAFYNDDLRRKIKEKYFLKDKEVFAYMPTWRGSSRNANIELQKKIVLEHLSQIDKLLKNNQILFVNLHFLLGNDINLSNMKHIKMFPQEYETYDFLNVCDVLITDYSSVFFDFAVTKKKIILFTYDLDEYLLQKGTYFSIDTLPFPIVYNIDDLIYELNNTKKVEYDDFYNDFCCYSSKNTIQELLDFLVFNKKNNIVIKNIPYNFKENVFIHIDTLKNQYQEKIVFEFLSQLQEDKNYIVLFNGNMNQKMIEFIQNLSVNIQIYAYVNQNYFTFAERVLLKLFNYIGFFGQLGEKKSKKAFQREFKRKFSNLKIDCFINLFDYSYYVARELQFLECEKCFVKIPKFLLGLKNEKFYVKNNIQFQTRNYDTIIDYNNKIIDFDEKEKIYNSSISFHRLFSSIKNKNNQIILSIVFLSRCNHKFNLQNCKIFIGNLEVDSKCTFSKGLPIIKHLRLNKIKIYIDVKDILFLPIQNKITVSYIGENEYGFKKTIGYSILKYRKSYSSSKVIKLNDKTCCYLRQSKGNAIFLTVRVPITTDNFRENLKIRIAYYISFIYRINPILLFEKDSSRYEESASVVYERLIDEGYKNAFFILDKQYTDISKIPNKYMNNIIYKYSFKHYLYFFKSYTFLGSEELIHVIELRCKNSLILKKINSTKNDFVFLQHGVMYMISLDSESRAFFKPRSIDEKGKYRVVTSSKREADHFITLGGYDSSQVIICGLPKYDNNLWDKNADKIVIMLTWRPWEYNEIMTDFTSSKYYQMLYRIYSAIPPEYYSKLIILPHPLFYNAAEKNDFELKKYMLFNVKYDEILRYCKILITDYSSIAYDAFYRGTNIIFYWEELQECLNNYGKNAKLMLNETNVFGDICMNENDLIKVLSHNYYKEQNEIFINRYKDLVSFHDGKNTERLIEKLKDEKII